MKTTLLTVTKSRLVVESFHISRCFLGEYFYEELLSLNSQMFTSFKFQTIIFFIMNKTFLTKNFLSLSLLLVIY